MSQILEKYLNNRYPFYYHLNQAVLIGVFVLVSSTIFNFLFEPFDVNPKELKFSFFMVSLIHSGLSLIVFMFFTLLLNKINIEKLEWRVKYELMFLFTVLLIIGVFQYLIRDLIYDKDDNWSVRYLYEEIKNTFLIGGLLIFIITSINVERLKDSYLKRGKRLKINKSQFPTSSIIVAIKTQVVSDDFSMDISQFIFAKSDKNYVEIFMSENTTLLKRMTIKSLEHQLSDFDGIFKTHRSYIVNLNSIENIEGNTQGYRLRIKGTNLIVPVSRGMITSFETQLKIINS